MKRLWIALLCCSLTGCGWNPFGKKHKSRRATTYFVHGDPLSLIAGSTQTTQSPLLTTAAANYSGFHVMAIMYFVEKEPKANPTNYEQVEAENSTDADEDEIEDAFTLEPYEFVATGSNTYRWQPKNGASGTRLGFTANAGRLEFTDIDGTAVTIQHYSLKADGKAFSLLASYSHSRAGKVMAAFYFADSSVVNPIAYSTGDYSYLTGNAKVRWETPMSIKTCGSYTSNQLASIKSSLDAWFNDPQSTAQKTPVSYEVATSYKPFSDLDEHCIYLADSFKLENSDNFYVAGVSLPITNLASKAFVDNDLFIFTSQTRVAAAVNKGEASETVMHEIGHFFGLGHEFRKDSSGNALHPSIMGYSTGTSEVTEWDYAAIRELYGQSLGLASP